MAVRNLQNVRLLQDRSGEYNVACETALPEHSKVELLHSTWVCTLEAMYEGIVLR